MPRLIDADALIISLSKDRSALVNNHVTPGEIRRVDETIWKIVEAHTIDPVRGRWTTNSNYPDTVICSVCGYRADVWWVDKGTRYCPDCGALMDEGGGE